MNLWRVGRKRGAHVVHLRVDRPLSKRLFRELNKFLIIRTLDKNHVNDPLERLLDDGFKAQGCELLTVAKLNYELKIPWNLKRGPRLHREFLQQRGPANFRYGDPMRPRRVKRPKFHPWGLKGKTEAGVRSFNWEKIATATIPLAQALELHLSEDTSGGIRQLSLTLFEQGGDGQWTRKLEHIEFGARLKKDQDG